MAPLSRLHPRMHACICLYTHSEPGIVAIETSGVIGLALGDEMI